MSAKPNVDFGMRGRKEPRRGSASSQFSGNTAWSVAKANLPSTNFITVAGEMYPLSGMSEASAQPDTRPPTLSSQPCTTQLASDADAHGPSNVTDFALDKQNGYLLSPVELQPQAMDFETTSNGTISLKLFMQAVATERLHHMPHRASRWDRMIRHIEGFAIQISAFADQCQAYAVNVHDFSSIVYANCHALMRLGSGHSASLEFLLPLLIDTSNALSVIVRGSQRSTRVSELLGQVFDRVSDMTTKMNSDCQEIINAPTQRSAIGTDMPFPTRKSMEYFLQLKDEMIEELWGFHRPDTSSILGPLVPITRIRLWLQPQDLVVQRVYADMLRGRAIRDEFTCQWFSGSLLEFVRSSDRLFWLEGPPGCGKSTLYGWTIESLRRPVGGQKYDVITYTVDSTLPTEATMSSLVKGLLSQLVEYHIGPSGLYSALSNMINAAATSANSVGGTKALMDALLIAFRNIADPLMVVIDGLNELGDREDQIIALLHVLVDFEPNTNIRTIIFSRPLKLSSDFSPRRLSIEPSCVQDDLHRMAASFLSYLPSRERADVVQSIVQRAHGNFLWLMFVFLPWDTTKEILPSDFKALPNALDTACKQLISGVDLSAETVPLLLSTCAVAQRPLSLGEIEILMRLDLENRKWLRVKTNVQELVVRNCKDILIIRGGLVQFRHPFLKQTFAQDHTAPTMYAHTDLANRLLLYLRIVLAGPSELAFNPVAPYVMERLETTNLLLNYALRYWTVHFRKSEMFDDPGSPILNSACRVFFPNSVYSAIVENTFWSSQPAYDSLQALTLATRLRMDLLGSHLSVLQSTVLSAKTLDRMSQFEPALLNYKLAFDLSVKLLPEFHSFIALCANGYLDILNSHPDFEHGDADSAEPEILKYMIDVHGREFGSSSDGALHFNRLLAQYYGSRDAGQSAQIYRRIHELSVQRYGKASPQTKAATDMLVAALQRNGQRQAHEIVQYSDSVFDNIVHSFAVTDPQRIRASISKAESCKDGVRNDLIDAELLYLNLWHGIADAHQRKGDDSVENIEKQLEIALLYARYLIQSKRVAEAQGILLGLWGQFERAQRSSSVNDLFEEIALELNSMGLTGHSLEILGSVLDWNRTHDAFKSEEARASALRARRAMLNGLEDNFSLQNQSQEVLRRTFETVTEGSQTDQSAINLARTLIESFKQSQRWQDVIWAANKVLQLTWPSVLGDQVNVPDIYHPELGNMVLDLAQAHMMMKQLTASGQLYWQLFHAAKGAHNVDSSSTVSRAAQAALVIYKKTGHKDRIQHVYQDLHEYYQANFGEAHESTVESLYSLASFSMEQQDTKHAVQYFSKIAKSLNGPDCHSKQAIPALEALFRIHLTEQSWTKARSAFQSLWKVFILKAKAYDISPTRAKILYTEYIQFLEHCSQAGPDVLCKVTEEYRAGCITAFGDTSLVAVEAASYLAERLRSNEQTFLQAISLYEWINDELQDRPSLCSDEIKMIESQAQSVLTEFYRDHVSDMIVDVALFRAAFLQEKRYSNDVKLYGPLSVLTLTSLSFWISFLFKQATQEASNEALQEMQHVVEDLMSLAREPSALYDAATLLSSSYVNNGHAAEGLLLVQRLLQRTFFPTSNADVLSDSKNLEGPNSSNLMFLTTLEACLTGSKMSLGRVHSAAMLEAILWKNYQLLRKADTSRDTAIVYGARLWNLLLCQGSSSLITQIEDSLFDSFMTSYSCAFDPHARTIRAFFKILLQELGQERLEVDVPRSACIALNQHLQHILGQKSMLPTVSDVSCPGYQFISFIGAYEQEMNVEYGFELSLLLASDTIRSASDQNFSTEMFELSKSVMCDVVRICKTYDYSFERVDPAHLSKIVSLMGLHRNFEDLEWVLTRLWDGRDQFKSLSQDSIVMLGRRLVEARWAHGHTTSATDLAEDILYNLRRVYGPSHYLSIEMTGLLSSMYMAAGNDAAILAVNEEASGGGLKDGSNAALAVEAVKSNLDYLMQVYKQSDGTIKSVKQYAALMDDLVKRIGKPNSGISASDLAVTPLPVGWGFVEEEKTVNED